MTISMGARATGMPCGRKSVKNRCLCFTRAITVTPINTTMAMANVTMMWLVGVKLKGTSPRRFENKMNMNSVKMNGK